MEIRDTPIGQIAIIEVGSVGKVAIDLIKQLEKIKSQNIPVLVVDDVSKITEKNLEHIVKKTGSIGFSEQVDPTLLKLTPSKLMMEDDFSYESTKVTQHVPFYKNLPKYKNNSKINSRKRK